MNLFKCLVLAFVVNYAQCAQRTDVAETETAVSSGWLKSAQDTLAGPAGHMIVQVAKELINRSLGNSQVLSLNLSNLFILILLKALIFAAGLIGAGHWSNYARGRSETATSLLDEGEPMLFVGFLASQGSGDSACLYKAACHAPATAYEYARAAKALLNSIDKFGGSTDNKSQYENLIDTLQRAAYDGYKGSPCDLMYRCNL